MSKFIDNFLGFVDETYGMSDSDCMLVSYPKSGNTYVLFVMANLISQLYHNGATVDFHFLVNTMPEIGNFNLNKEWPYKDVPRLLKTHQIFKQSFKKTHQYIYITRDPRDICISFYHFSAALKKKTYHGTLSEFIRDDRYGLAKINLHIESWYDKSPLILKYEDLMESSKSINKLFKTIGVNIEADLLEKIVMLSAPENVKKLEIERGRPRADSFNKDFVFVRNARIEQWKSVYNDDDLEYFRRNVSDSFLKLGYVFLK